MAMMPFAVAKLSLMSTPPPQLRGRRKPLEPPRCASFHQEQVDVAILCEFCNGKGWLLCDFCKGLKTDVKAENNRLYRRCPSCRTVGFVLCSKCKVFRCVTFPDNTDGQQNISHSFNR